MHTNEYPMLCNCMWKCATFANTALENRYQFLAFLVWTSFAPVFSSDGMKSDDFIKFMAHFLFSCYDEHHDRSVLILLFLDSFSTASSHAY